MVKVYGKKNAKTVDEIQKIIEKRDWMWELWEFKWYCDVVNWLKIVVHCIFSERINKPKWNYICSNQIFKFKYKRNIFVSGFNVWFQELIYFSRGSFAEGGN